HRVHLAEHLLHVGVLLSQKLRGCGLGRSGLLSHARPLPGVVPINHLTMVSASPSDADLSARRTIGVGARTSRRSRSGRTRMSSRMPVDPRSVMGSAAATVFRAAV